jgi:hypothetical protein
MDRRDVLQHQVGAGLSTGEVIDHAWGAVSEGLIHAFYPEIPGLIDVRIG